MYLERGLSNGLTEPYPSLAMDEDLEQRTSGLTGRLYKSLEQLHLSLRRTVGTSYSSTQLSACYSTSNKLVRVCP